MLWPFIVGALIGTVVLAGYTRRRSRIWSSPRLCNAAMTALVTGFVLAAALRLVLWQYLVLLLVVLVSLAGLGCAIFRACTRRQWRVLVCLLLAIALVPLLALSMIVFNRIMNPITTIEGRVVYADTGQPATGVLVEAASIDGSQRTGWAYAVTDEHGVYRLKSLPRAQYHVWVSRAEGWTARALDSFQPSHGARAPDLVLVRGTLVRGKVVDAVTGKPATPATGYQTVGCYGPARPATSVGVEMAYIQSDGRFELRVPSGKNYIYVMHPGGSSHQWVDVPEDGPIEIELAVR